MDVQSRKLITAMLCRSVAFLGCCLLVVSETSADEVAKKAVAAWERHQSAISSIQYHCEIATTQLVEFATSFPPAAPAQDSLTSPFPDEKASVQPIVLHSNLTFSLSKGKFAIHSAGETWDYDKKMRVNRDFRECFDGKDAILLDQVQGAHYVHGDVVVGADGRTVDQLPNEFVTGLLLGDAPKERLERTGYLVPKMSVRDSKATDENGRACIEMSIPRKGGQMGTLLLDPSRDYLPIRFVGTVKGVVTWKQTIEYAPNEQAHWTVSAWTTSSFSDTGKFRQAVSGRTKNVSVDKPIDDAIFTITFPVGTHISQSEHGRGRSLKYFVHEANGSRREISEDDYGKLPDERRPAGPPMNKAGQ